MDEILYKDRYKGPIPGMAYAKAGQGLYQSYFGGGKEGIAYMEAIQRELMDAQRRGGDVEVRKLAESDPDKYANLSLGYYKDGARGIAEYKDQTYLKNVQANPFHYAPQSVEYGGGLDPYLEALHNAFKLAQGMSDAPVGEAAATVAAPIAQADTMVSQEASIAPAAGMASDASVVNIENQSSSMDLELAATLAEQERLRQSAMNTGSDGTLLGNVNYTLGS